MEIYIFKMRLIRIIIIYVKIMRRPYITPLKQQHSSRIRNVSKYKSPNHPLYYSSTLYFFSFYNNNIIYSTILSVLEFYTHAHTKFMCGNKTSTWGSTLSVFHGHYYDIIVHRQSIRYRIIHIWQKLQKLAYYCVLKVCSSSSLLADWQSDEREIVRERRR